METLSPCARVLAGNGTPQFTPESALRTNYGFSGPKSRDFILHFDDELRDGFAFVSVDPLSRFEEPVELDLSVTEFITG